MKSNQLTKGKNRRLMYVENKQGQIDGLKARIGWVEFSKSGLSIYYRGRVFKRLGGQGIRGNYYDKETMEEYWISGVKQDKTDSHWSSSITPEIDHDAKEAYEEFIASGRI